MSKKGNEYCTSDIKIVRRLSRKEIIDRLNNVESEVENIMSNIINKTNDFVIENGVLMVYSGNDTKVIVPNEVEVIGNYAFIYNTNIEEVILPNGLEIIENGAFTLCKNLTKINIPETVTKIEGYAFAYCENLKEINLPKNLQIIERCSFACCNKLKQIEGYYKIFYIENGKLVDWNNYTFEIGKSYHQAGKIEVYENGFYFHKRISDLSNHFCGEIDKDFVICEVEVSGDIDALEEEEEIYYASDIKIVRRLSREEIIDRLNNVESEVENGK